MNYTLGFVFTPSFDRVLLMHRLKPAFQAGKLNGLGGKIEMGERALDGMVRELKEEAGLATNPAAWVRVGVLRNAEASMEVFGYVHHGALDEAATQEKEVVEWVDARHLSANAMKSLRWLVPLTIDRLERQNFQVFVIEEWDSSQD